MRDPLCPPEDLPKWVPGQVILGSDGQGWRNVALRSYRYCGQDVIVPAMRDYMIVSCRAGDTPMQRRFGGRWRHDHLGPGAASLLTRAQRAHWCWSAPVEVTHLYLAPTLVAEVASEVMERPVSGVELADVLRTDDPVLTAAVAAITAEAETRALGGPLYVEAIARGLIVHLLRRYASVRLAPHSGGAEGLSPCQIRLIREHVEANLAETLDLGGMAALLGMGVGRFTRLFRQSFGCAPYAHVLARRLCRARELLAATGLPIKEIAMACGFSDQAHLTRLFVRDTGTTPAAYRRALQGARAGPGGVAPGPPQDDQATRKP